MKVAFCVEDENDRLLYAHLVEKVLGAPVEIHKREYALREGGVGTALRLAHPIVRDAFQAGADAVVLAIDNDDDEPAHAHLHKPVRESTCRWCKLVFAANLPEVQRWAKASGQFIGFVVAVPVRTIETWLLLAAGHAFSGAPESTGLGATGRKRLKRILYDKEGPDRRTVQARAIPLIASLEVAAVAARSESFRHFVEQIRALPFHGPLSTASPK